ncbi:MAG: NAD(P)-binding protein, partial [Microlunatus sp.]|nr:NAD(P)-binding protein [Microlunatus sp.]
MSSSSTSPPDQDHLDHVDVLIVGAGLSGIGAACHLRRQCPGKTMAIFEARDRMGGTWDLFR